MLHDGAPNVGKNWLHDAYGQNVLVVRALKIACTHLRKGGWFVTKIFRSADYNSLLWVFGKLFAKVHATKPQASRQESAEIFVVCQDYKKPDQIDPKFFDPTSLFADISNYDETLKKKKADLLKPAAKVKKARALGYEGEDVLKIVTDIEFVTSSTHMDFLATCHQIKLTSEDIINHESTNEEIKACCADLRVLGRKELLKLLKWRREVRKDLAAKMMNIISEKDDADPAENSYLDQLTLNSDDELDDEVPELNLDDIEAQQDLERKKEEKRLRRKEEKKIKNYKERLTYGMVNEGDVLIEEEYDLFSLKKIHGKKELSTIEQVEPDEVVEDEVPEPEPDVLPGGKKKARKVSFSREADIQYFDSDDEIHTKDENSLDKTSEKKIEVPKGVMKNNNATAPLSRLSKANTAGGGLLSDLMNVNESKLVTASKFFDHDQFSTIDLERELEADLVETIFKEGSRKAANGLDTSKEEDLDRFESESDNDSDSETSVQDAANEMIPKKQIKLDPEGLALASMMVSSDKLRKQIEDEGWNRYSHADAHLAPRWFREEEEKHFRRNIPVSSELVKEYKQRLRQIDAQPIKKVLQAKGRKKRRAMRKMEKVRKKVEAITGNDDLTQKDRINQIKTVYKNATKSKKKEVKLVVSKKGVPLKKPAKGKYKTVDARMKKDLRAQKRRMDKGKGGKSRGKSKAGGKGKPKGKRSSFSGGKRPKSNKASRR